MTAPPRPCLVHLVREANGLDPVRRFLDSYRDHEAGVEHELVLLFKGFASEAAAGPHRELAADLQFESVFVDDRGFDLDAYLAAAARLGRPRYCFLNSFSQISAPGWLGLLNQALDARGVGLAGSTGSWGSTHSYLFHQLHLPSAYKEVFPNRSQTRALMRRVEDERQGPDAPQIGTLQRRLGTAREMIDLAIRFPPFPARHVRTNAFMVSGEVLGALDAQELRRKVHAYRLESGRRGIMRQVEQMGLRAVVVGHDGVAYEPEQWPESETFWQGCQANLLVSDNQTRQYARSDLELRELLSRFAWGQMARPLPD